MFDRRGWLERLIFEGEVSRRFTQDSPVLPDVWIQFGMRALDDFRDEEYWPPERRREDQVDLLLTPHMQVSAADLARVVRRRLEDYRKTPAWSEAHPGPSLAPGIAHNQASVAVRLYLDELVRGVLPLSRWWREGNGGATLLKTLETEAGRAAVAGRLEATLSERRPVDRASGGSPASGAIPGALLWLVRVVGSIELARARIRAWTEAHPDATPDERRDFTAVLRGLPRDPANCREMLDQFARIAAGLEAGPAQSPLWSVSLNREVRETLERSTLAVKADAARRLFRTSCAGIAWAVVDSGIDATHPAFRVRRGRDEVRSDVPLESRVVETYDFTRIRELLDPDAPPEARPDDPTGPDPETRERLARDLKRRLEAGRGIDWDALGEILRVPHDAERYRPPVYDHGTHVAGILAGDWRREERARDVAEAVGEAAEAEDGEGGDLTGVCPDLKLYDFRVLDDEGRGSEFEVLAALQFLRYLNDRHDQPWIHGANMSLSMRHDVANFACGRTPVCEECERLIGSGVVVVAAAGNDGYMKYMTPEGDSEGYRSISISDPGNAEAVITVGATHRFLPHMYGVSYFSSRGPTGDGRMKPDLVAPGEKITAPTPGCGFATKDGTSMAAPHVSGAAALLMARHCEFMGRPQRIKEILCATATDLRRERYFQGAGMVDILRALQSV